MILPSATEHADGIKKSRHYWKKVSGNDQPLPDTYSDYSRLHSPGVDSACFHKSFCFVLL